MCLPQIAEAMAEDSNSDNRQGWLYLHDMFEKWLSGHANVDPLSNSVPFWVSMPWALSYSRVNVAYLKLCSLSYLFSNNARALLADRLRRDNYFSPASKKDFDYTTTNWNSWKQNYFQQITVEGFLAVPPDGLTAAMGSFQLRTLAKGYTVPEGNGHAIIITGVSVIIWDSFNFDGEYDLRYWQCDPPAYSTLKKDDFINLTNNDFRNFQNRCGRGNNFLVLSEPYPIDPRVQFTYDTDL